MIEHAYPKILKPRDIDSFARFLASGVEITEKIDGSQFAFGKINRELVFRSKGKQLFPEACPKMFQRGIEYVKSIENRIPPDLTFYCEYLEKPRHNTLSYNRIPKNHLYLFGVKYIYGGFISERSALTFYADMLEIDSPYYLNLGEAPTEKMVEEAMERESVLGNSKVEGYVFKKYVPCVFQNIVFPITAVKLVSDRFKEAHQGNRSFKKPRDTVADFMGDFKTEARWLKALQRMRDAGELTHSPRDIGGLMKSVQTDIVEEESTFIKEKLYGFFIKKILRGAVGGLPEWYKEKLKTEAEEV